MPKDCDVDIVFVVDESGSITLANFNLTKSFLSHLVGRLDIESGRTRVGLVTFASGVGTGFNLSDFQTIAPMKSAISSLSYSQGGTNTDRALAYVRTTMLTPAAGDRTNVSNVVVVVTDGHSENSDYTLVCKKN